MSAAGRRHGAANAGVRMARYVRRCSISVMAGVWDARKPDPRPKPPGQLRSAVQSSAAERIETIRARRVVNEGFREEPKIHGAAIIHVPAKKSRRLRLLHHCYRVSLGGGRSERFADIAAELVRRKVDVIVQREHRRCRGKAGDIGYSDRFSLAGSATVSLPLARPGGNVTGLSRYCHDRSSAARAFARSFAKPRPARSYGKYR